MGKQHENQSKPQAMKTALPIKAEGRIAIKQLIDLLAAGECKGIKGGTAYRIEEFARERGFL